MTGVIDVGGGLRGIYGTGAFGAGQMPDFSAERLLRGKNPDPRQGKTRFAVPKGLCGRVRNSGFFRIIFRQKKRADGISADALFGCIFKS